MCPVWARRAALLTLTPCTWASGGRELFQSVGAPVLVAFAVLPQVPLSSDRHHLPLNPAEALRRLGQETGIHPKAEDRGSGEALPQQEPP